MVDAADPEWRTQFGVTRSVLEEVDAANIPSLVVFNKMDKVPPGSDAQLLAEHPGALCVSAQSADDALRIRKALEAFFDREVIRGTTLNYRPEGIGFFVTPADTSGNNQRVFVINGAMLKLAAAAVRGFTIESFGSAVLGALVLSIISFFLNVFVADSGRIQYIHIEHRRP